MKFPYIHRNVIFTKPTIPWGVVGKLEFFVKITTFHTISRKNFFEPDTHPITPTYPNGMVIGKHDFPCR